MNLALQNQAAFVAARRRKAQLGCRVKNRVKVRRGMRRASAPIEEKQRVTRLSERVTLFLEAIQDCPIPCAELD